MIICNFHVSTAPGGTTHVCESSIWDICQNQKLKVKEKLILTYSLVLWYFEALRELQKVKVFCSLLQIIFVKKLRRRSFLSLFQSWTNLQGYS